MTIIERLGIRPKNPGLSECSPSPEEIEILKAESFKFFRNFVPNPYHWSSVGFRFKREFVEEWGESELAYGYEELLPRIDGKTVVELLVEKANNLAPGCRVKVLDIGCDGGKALFEMADPWEPWAKKVDLKGLTANISEKSLGILGEKSVKIIVGDAHDLRKLFPETMFDLILSCSSLGYMADQVKVLEGIWGILREGGVASLNWILWSEEAAGEILLINKFFKDARLEIHLIDTKVARRNQRTGECFRFCQATMLKNQPGPLIFPVYPAGIGRPWQEYPPILTYRFNQKV